MNIIFEFYALKLTRNDIFSRIQNARICLNKFQLYVDLDINTLQVVFNKLRNFIFSGFIFLFFFIFHLGPPNSLRLGPPIT